MDVELAMPFIKATNDVISAMAMVQVKAGKPFVKKDNIAIGDVSAIVGFTGDQNGSFSMTFNKGLAIAIVKNMLGDDVEDIISDVKDAVGELTNIISGQSRATLAQKGLQFNGSTPTIIMGEKHTISHAVGTPIMAIPFSSDYGDLIVEFSME